ncbi:hypothetical protein ABWK22_02855 [Gottfriedia acidiceleris]|uniref:hypothetical protein n=1 Tax=Gottfriedia acidiceleris TaxID=371036 RepID=UPI003396A5E3
MIPGFFKDMPKKEDLNKVGRYRIEVYQIRFRENVTVYSKVVKGKMWAAYLKVRIKALFEDWATSGRYYGIGWRIKKDMK